MGKKLLVVALGVLACAGAMAQSRAIGRAEAAQWWLRAIRDNCPERESQMRAEANAAMKRLQSQLQRNEEGNDDD